MTDNEIIKALERCGSEYNFCADCPYFLQDKENDFCREDMCKNALDLINRQKAEIERLQEENRNFRKLCDKAIKTYKETKSEAIKEFVERFRKCAKEYAETHITANLNKPDYIPVEYIDNLVKEMMDCQ